MIWLLIIILFVMTLVNWRLSKLDLFNPNFLFCVVFFLFSSIAGISTFFIDIDINNVFTVIIIIFSAMLFTISNYFFRIKNTIECSRNINTLKISKVILIIFVFVELALCYENYKYINDLVSAYGISGDFTDKILFYKILITFHDADDILVSSSTLRNRLSQLGVILSYIGLYKGIYDLVFLKKKSYLCLLVVCTFLVSSLMEGERSETFRMVTAGIFLWYIFSYKISDKREDVSGRVKKIIGILFFVVLFFFLFLFVSGRSDDDASFQLFFRALFIYAGAPIFNLDIYLDNPYGGIKDIFGEMTFVRLINGIGVRFDIPNYRYTLDLPFITYGNLDFGNVYTTFYAFYYDFGMIGCFFLPIGILLFYNHLYSIIMRLSLNVIAGGKISYIIIVYAYMINDLIMLPFSNRFYETFFNIGTIIMFIYMYVIIIIFNAYIKRKEKYNQ